MVLTTQKKKKIKRLGHNDALPPKNETDPENNCENHKIENATPGLNASAPYD